MVLRRWEGIEPFVNRSDEGLTLETLAFLPFLPRPIHFFNSVVNTKLPAILKADSHPTPLPSQTLELLLKQCLE